MHHPRSTEVPYQQVGGGPTGVLVNAYQKISLSQNLPLLWLNMMVCAGASKSK